MPNKRFQATKIFLTFPQCDTDKNVALENIKQKFDRDLDYAVVGHEYHQDGSSHLHAYVKLFKQFRTSNPHELDVIGGKQGKYEVSKTEYGSIKHVTKDGCFCAVNIQVEEYLERCEKKIARSDTKGVDNKVSKVFEERKILKAIEEGKTLKELMDMFPQYMLHNLRKVKEYMDERKKQSL